MFDFDDCFFFLGFMVISYFIFKDLWICVVLLLWIEGLVSVYYVWDFGVCMGKVGY